MYQDINIFGKNLRGFRKKSGLTQREYATAHDYISYSTLSKLESSDSFPGTEVALLFAKEMNIPIYFFLSEEGCNQYEIYSSSDIYESLVKMSQRQLENLNEVLYSIYKVCDSPFISTNGSDIKYMRKRREISQEELAQYADMKKKTLVHCEDAKVLPRLSHLVKISDRLAIPLDFFIRDKGVIHLRYSIYFLLVEIKKFKLEDRKLISDSIQFLIDNL